MLEHNPPDREPKPLAAPESSKDESALDKHMLPARPAPDDAPDLQAPAPLEEGQTPDAAKHSRVLFRGSFNPFHEGHLSVVVELLERGYETVVISPVTTSPGKGTIDTPVPLRAEMIKSILRAEGIKIASSPDEPGVYVVGSRSEARKELTRALLSKTDFALGDDNDANYEGHSRWRWAKKLGEDRIVVVKSVSTVHSSAIRRGEVPAHPAIRDLIAENSLYGQGAPKLGLDRFQNAVVLYNPISGSGSAKQLAHELAVELNQRGVKTALLPSCARYAPGELEALFAGKDLIVVAGGDGTMMGALGGLANSKAAVYMVPAGNESLFSKQFAMKKERDGIIEDLSTRAPKEHYYGVAGEKPFFLMLSVGLDSMILEHIGERKGHSSTWMYVQAALGVLPSYRTPVVNLKVDGVPVVNGEQGYLIIANTNSYGRDLNLVPEATSAEPKLVARFFPQSGWLAEIGKGIRMAFRLPADLSGSRVYMGDSFELAIDNGPYPAQADGDFLGRIGSEPLKISSSKSPIKVLSE